MNEASNTSNLQNIITAIYSVNKHAKAALEPKYLYFLKEESLILLHHMGIATKVGLQYNTPSNQGFKRSFVLMQIGDYFFHIPPQKQDFHQLPHLGAQTAIHRNPKSCMSIKKAKSTLETFLGETALQFTPRTPPMNKGPTFLILTAKR